MRFEFHSLATPHIILHEKIAIRYPSPDGLRRVRTHIANVIPAQQHEHVSHHKEYLTTPKRASRRIVNDLYNHMYGRSGSVHHEGHLVALHTRYLLYSDLDTSRM